ncbi:hypothetical protein [Aeromonas veronii]|uniref:hypothetical protein n=1 Tax=Aeromonas veronii TaxID=654 RepID=UPI0024448F0D|nr:hypothetical protein [Aeromonas veronii]
MSASTSAEILKAYQTLSLSDANESATRLKVIDRVLREILGWLDEDISPEEHVTEDGNTSYSDYILRTANTAIVVEAKKSWCIIYSHCRAEASETIKPISAK